MFLLISAILHAALFLFPFRDVDREVTEAEPRWIQLVEGQRARGPSRSRRGVSKGVLSERHGRGAGLGGGRPTVIAMGELMSLGNMAPEYPERARRMGWEGEVLLHLEIGTEGKVEDVRVSRSSGFDILDDAARKSARSWHWRTGQATALLVPVIYELRR